MKTASIAVVVSETGRRYVWAKDIAGICAVSDYLLDTKYRPYGWATPRDFKWTGSAMLIAEESLSRLADSLSAHGLTDAALQLREFVAAHLVRAMEEKELSQGGLERLQPGSHKPRDAGSNPAPASNSAPVGWARKWEDDHDA